MLDHDSQRLVRVVVTLLCGIISSGIAPGQTATPTSEASKSNVAEFATILDQRPTQPPPVQRVSADEVATVQLILGELSDQVRIASAKLDPEMLALKRKIGTLRSMINSTDRRIARLSATVQRLTERRRQLEKDLVAHQQSGAPKDVTHDAVMMRMSRPIETANAKRERLSRYRAQLQEQLSTLRRQHIRCLLTAAVEDQQELDFEEMPDIEAFFKSKAEDSNKPARTDNQNRRTNTQATNRP